jgi:hypothetical protein
MREREREKVRGIMFSLIKVVIIIIIIFNRYLEEVGSKEFKTRDIKQRERKKKRRRI